jgi:hypothetical protein
LPALEFTMALAILACCLVLRFNRIGLVTGYFFSYKWGWSLFAEHSDQYLFAYLVFGCLVGILGVIGMLYSKSGT